MPSVCIECGNEKEGYPVKEDYVIAAIRKVKTMLRVAKNNTLVVCQGCVDARKVRRERFEKRFVQHGAVAVIVFLFLVLFPVFFGGGKDLIGLVQTVLTAAVLGLVIIFFALLNYSPAFEEGKKVGGEGGHSKGKQEAGEMPAVKRETAKKAAAQKSAAKKRK